MDATRGRSRRIGWIPGLRARTAIAMVVAVTAACAALTVATTQWATTSHRERMERQVLNLVENDVGWLFAGLAEDSSARTLDELAATSWGADRGKEEFSNQAILIPLASQGDEPRPEQALWWLLVNTERPLQETHPECLAPRGRAGPLIGGSSQFWAEECGPFLIAYAMAQPEQGTPWLVKRILYLPDQEDPVPPLRTTLLQRSAVIVAVSILLALLLAASVVRPVRRAAVMAGAVADGNLSVRIPVRGNDDVTQMSRAVNTMADRLTGQIADLERANEAQRRFVSDVAHELRTPAAALLASAEALQDPGTRDEAAALVAPQLRRLAALTADLLEISRMDAGRAETVASRIDVVDLISEAIGGAESEIAYDGPAELWTSTDPVRLRVVVGNLVANAVQHGAPPVTVSLTRGDSWMAVDVHDAGPGVPLDLREHIFDRFVRGDASRHGSSSGLGLAIAVENARLLDGALTLEDDGATFRLTLPAEDSRAVTT
ncbi:MAG: HAMP domain-containing histidine kinase [Tessaracoccus sp.]|uniref:sensor histidine kinase n=1 Tax=Tessaracoccus sp. TaxID=1971211 RepID=UPI001EC26B06|nr:HAMP domain-containing sensor histidine kinase [Tessaracoccus sp.]MBK7822007.1 HAMP domain-containing histidine kinase [Tessaracoccus sp.]